MKKLIYIFIIAGLLPVFSSCSNMLDEVNYGNPTTEDMMSNPENVILLVGQAYADIKWVHDHWGYWGVASLTSDECLCPVRNPNENWADAGYWKNLNTHNWNSLGEAFRNIWNSTISGAVLCNKLLQTINDYKESMGEDSYKQFIGELEVLRSYYYYLLFDCFGRIPYLEEFVDKTEALMEPEIVWSRLVACLERNAPNMPVVNDGNRAANYGRVTQGFAYGLLTRLYLNAESFGCTAENIDLDKAFYEANPSVTKITSTTDFYTNAVRCADNVINSGSYTIEPNFFTNFKILNEDSKENIFVIVENGNADFDLRYNGSMSNKLRILHLTLTYSMQQTWGMIEKPWNGFCARPSYLDRYAATDVRGPGNEGLGTNNTKQWGWFLGPVYDAKGKNLLFYDDDPATPADIRKEVESLDNATFRDGARMFKYEVDRNGKYTWAENDFVLMRYADILWMKEEAIKRGGIGASGMGSADFQTMLKRSFAYDPDPMSAFNAAYGDVTGWSLDQILDERGRELAWELVRRRDLIRYNKFNDPTYVEYVTGIDEFRKWFPIPYAVLEKSALDENDQPYWTQNEGY